ncbi:unnamed protein product [Cyprideis torosa]|uniref:Uncharacterized protein n=1 Tax=Cyprideis torosa TaxID=163714 RepID=A0A7R8W478_9CRUS|nr:unnamed protein product [Cyprideis torosa]CAG0881624.1 unnamed protein product [Cyprideis torosa]
MNCVVAHEKVEAFRQTLALWQRRIVVTVIGISRQMNEELIFKPADVVQKKMVNESFVITCECCHPPVRDDVTIDWLGERGKRITSKKEAPIHVERTRNGAILFFTPVVRDVEGIYICSDRNRTMQKDFRLIVNRPINFDQTPTIQYAEEGSDFNMTCIVDGEPKPEAKWIYIGPKSERVSVVNKTLLMIMDVRRTDAGEKQCKAVQSNDEISLFDEHWVTLVVRHKPEWVPNQQSVVYTYDGGSVNLTCEVISEPPATFEWHQMNSPIQTRNGVRIFNAQNASYLEALSKDKRRRARVGAGRGAGIDLAVEKWTPLRVERRVDFGDYTCKATNSLGTISRVISLQEGHPPPRPSAKAKLVGNDFVEFQIFDNGAGMAALPIESYVVEYKREREDWETAHSRKFKLGDVYKITELRPMTIYVFRIAAENAAGRGQWSTEIRKQTLAATLTSTASSPHTNTTPVPC